MDHALAWALSSHLGDIIGYLASALVLATFSMRSMRPLRLMAIASNLAFIAYAAIGSMPPILILHSILLPMNVMRLSQMDHDTAHRVLASSPAQSPTGQGLTSLGLPQMVMRETPRVQAGRSV